jgi:anti-sigma factor RsiW
MNSREQPLTAGAGPCEDRAFELMEFVDGALPADEAARQQRHVASCARCRAFVASLGQVSASLAAALPSPVVSAGFDQRLRARIAGLPRTARDEAALAGADHEYREALATLRHGLRWRTTLNAIATAAVAGGLWIALSDVAPSVSAALGLGASGPLATALALSAVAVAAGAGATRAFQRSGTSLLG